MMKRRLAFTLVLVLALQVMWVGSVAAKKSSSYNPKNDITLSITVAKDVLKLSDSTGKATFEAQEEVHQTVTDISGQEVEHSYVWVEVNGKKILAVDPPCAYFPE
jgi:lipopolysaccharide export system protein LptA